MNWFTIKTYIDIDTGEILQQQDAETNYTTIKKKNMSEFKTNNNPEIIPDSLITQSYAVNDPSSQNSSQLIEREPIPGTPFWLIHNPEQGWFIAMGHYRLTEPLRSKQAAYLQLESEQWNIICNVMAIICEAIHNKELELNQELSLA